jgi:hypothetical protein
LKPQEIEIGKVYLDEDGIGRYVIEITMPSNRKHSWVTWRRPGTFATIAHKGTLRRFSTAVVREDPDQRVDPAPDLPNNGMALETKDQT